MVIPIVASDTFRCNEACSSHQPAGIFYGEVAGIKVQVLGTGLCGQIVMIAHPVR